MSASLWQVLPDRVSARLFNSMPHAQVPALPKAARHSGCSSLHGDCSEWKGWLTAGLCLYPSLNCWSCCSRLQVLAGANLKGLSGGGDQDWLAGIATFLQGAAAVQAPNLDPLQVGLCLCSHTALSVDTSAQAALLL